MRTFEIEAIGMGTNNSNYPGAFTPRLNLLITSLLSGAVLHLFSGSSRIGDERVDIEHSNATRHCDIREFIASDDRQWDWTILDPPYAIIRAKTKLASYGKAKAISSDVLFRRKLKHYFIEHTHNILWLDFCAPMVPTFKRQKLWLVLPGGFHTVRVLSWLVKDS
jgi:hypothetical protein